MLEVVEEVAQVLVEGTAAAGGLALGVAGEAEGAVVERDAAEVLAEDGDLLPPGQVVAAGAVGEDDGGAVAVGLVVEVDAVDGGVGHGGRVEGLGTGD